MEIGQQLLGLQVSTVGGIVAQGRMFLCITWLHQALGSCSRKAVMVFTVIMTEAK